METGIEPYRNVSITSCIEKSVSIKLLAAAGYIPLQ